jgi:hypothetical protein
MYKIEGTGSLLEGAGFALSTVETREVDAEDGGQIVVPSAHLLFSGGYQRVGADLVITDQDHKIVVHDYFKVVNRPSLLSPEGASLSDDVIAALAGPGAADRYAQVGTTASDATKAIGRVETVTGSASAVRNGVTVALNAGDAVYKGDVVQTDRGSTLGLIFIDGTVFNLTASARMVLNEMVYQAGAAGNHSLLSLVQGSLSFVAGQTAKTGDMKVATPVATMGIRGTAGDVTIDADNGRVRFAVHKEPDGHTGRYDLYRPDGSFLSSVASNEFATFVEPNGTASQVAKGLAEQQAEQAIVQQIFQLFAAGQTNPVIVGAPPPNPPAPGQPGGPSGGGGAGSSTSGEVNGATTQQPAGTPNSPQPTGPTPPGGSTPGTQGQPPQTGTPNGTTPFPETPTPPVIPNVPGAPPLASQTIQVAPNQVVLAAATGGSNLLLSGGATPDAVAAAHISTAHVGDSTSGGPEIPVTAGATGTTLTGRYGTLLIRQDGTYVYVALRADELAQNEHGTDSFTYTVVNSTGQSSSATLRATPGYRRFRASISSASLPRLTSTRPTPRNTGRVASRSQRPPRRPPRMQA